MKSLVRFTLLFALIVVGKLAKQSDAILNTAKVESADNPITVKPVSFNQQAAKTENSRLWHTMSPVASSAKSF
ncbi:hypothetical protein [Hymenobacter volaticus]|uniref:Uncharacterized protein n=1 Tax=Hymenobacter volaticus TaxID=2932254 RepID=A0ABY4G7L4_9BACT|nr:hypothetical protein [Hymenobacter volaticus]UOQ66755.1 hypothetical protein MUN86_02180 [Hymenobacter volaticus]